MPDDTRADASATVADGSSGRLAEGRSGRRSDAATDTDRLVRVARLYFLEREAQGTIAELMGVSASTVSRWIQQAVDRGIVRFEVVAPTEASHHDELADAVRQRLGIERCIVVPSAAKREGTSKSVARAASRAMLEYVKPGVVLGVSGGRLLREVANELAASAPKVEPGSAVVVQLMGGIAPVASTVQAHAVASRIARSLSAAVYLIHAPAILESRRALSGLLANRTVKQTTDLFATLDLAVVGLGSMAPDSPFVGSGFVTDGEAQRLADRRAVGDVCGRFLDADGQICDANLDARTLAISIRDLVKIPVVVVPVFGAEKAAIVRAAARAGFITVLVTDETTAESLLL